VIGVGSAVAGHGVVRNGGHSVADRSEEADGLVVSEFADAGRGGDSELTSELIDLPAAALLGAVSGHVDLGAVLGHGDGGVPVEVVGQGTQAGDEGLAGGGVGGESHDGSFQVRSQATAMVGPAGVAGMPV
jgi:hypothetical protein